MLGECVRIMTGAKMPADCDTVEMQENCRAENEEVEFLQAKKLGQNVRRAGEDIKARPSVIKQRPQINQC